MLLSIDYRPTKYSPIVIQWFRIRVYPVHHTMNNNFVDHIGIKSNDSLEHIMNMDHINNDIFIELLRVPDENAAFGQIRGTAGDLEPVVINGHALSHFDMTFHPKTGTFSFTGNLTSNQQAILLGWFGLSLKSFLNDHMVERLHQLEKERYIHETVGRLGRAIDSLVQIQEDLYSKLPPSEDPFVCPECEEELHIIHDQECRIRPCNGVIDSFGSSTNNTVQCTACDWNADNYMGIVEINLLLNKIK